MTEEDSGRHEVLGRVKWFDPAKGFGFIVADDSGGDILLHANVLRNFGQGSVADGARIRVMVQNTARGAQAIEVLEIEPPEGENQAPIEESRRLRRRHDRRPAAGAGPGQVVRQGQGLRLCQCPWPPRGCLHPYRGAAPVGFRRSRARRGDQPARDRRQARAHGGPGRRLGGRDAGGAVIRRALVPLVALALLAGPVAAACAPDVAEFHWPGGGARFSVEIADDAAERAQGLMNRASLPRGAGMLFIYDHPQPVAFWMKNTLIPLDMIFIGANGKVGAVHAQARARRRDPDSRPR